MRPTLWTMDAERQSSAESALRALLEFYSSASTTNSDAPNWPWDVFDDLIAQRPTDLPGLLRQLTTATQINVTTEVSRINPWTGDNQADRPIIRLADGRDFSLADWQIDVAHLRGERGKGMESYHVQNNMRFPYSVSRRGDQVLGIQLVSRKLAQASFGEDLTDATSYSPTDGGYSPNVAEVISDRPPPPIAPELANSPTAQLSALPSPDILNPAESETAGDALAFITEKRNRSWRERSMSKNYGAHRLALVQWDVTDSYYSPGHKGGIYEGLVTPTGDKAASAASVKDGGVFLSTSEHRRRALIREVLSACAKLKVDGLIFPEYSLRPETVNWLSRQLKSAALPITVWCGTFRVPNGTQLDFDFRITAGAPYAAAVLDKVQPGFSRWEYHTAVLTCLRAADDPRNGFRVEHFARQKRYPSAAAGELIRPPVDQPWLPLLADSDPFKLGTFTLELVCSEMFPHASSANFVGVIEENNELAARYGLGKGGETMFGHVSNDVYEFAKWTAYRNAARITGDAKKALHRGEALQRTLIVLPAMTNRSADYHIFGQNQYLAAGLVTAFCNAVAPHVGCGQSGFIGLDGWKLTEGSHTPYGSKAPGIFQLGSEHSGALGETETAMVIADLDLLRTADQRPRPHYQHRSLRLVAHLPIFFSTEKGDHIGLGAHPNKRRQLRLRTIDSKSQTFTGAVGMIAKALAVEADWRSSMNVANRDQSIPAAYEAAVSATTQALKMLEEFADDKHWLRKRTDSFKNERYDFPMMAPLPALIDWLYVDDRWLPGEYGMEAPEPGENPLESDKPLLSVPKSMTVEPALKTS